VTGWHEAEAPAKLNLALVAGPLRKDGKHEVISVLVRLSLADTIAVRRADSTRVEGFDGDTLVRAALDALSGTSPDEPCFEARIVKRIPVAAGLGGGSSDAATALRLANELLDRPLPVESLHRIAASLGSDVPFFLYDSPQLATADGTKLTPLTLPADYVVLLALPFGAAKSSTRAVYQAFDARGGERGFTERRQLLEAAVFRVARAADLASLPPNDLASSPLAAELLALGSFRADVTGAGPVVYALFEEPEAAGRAASTLEAHATTWVVRPA
jgi:4-diphosphocytidyl-2-C-methyl-D-erythritol kinase